MAQLRQSLTGSALEAIRVLECSTQLEYEETKEILKTHLLVIAESYKHTWIRLVHCIVC